MIRETARLEIRSTKERVMPASRSSFVIVTALAAGFISPGPCPADVMMSWPEHISISGMADHGDLIFVVFADGQIEKGLFLDPKTAEQAGQVRLPYAGLPKGDLSLLGVPRALAEKSKNSPDPAWLKEAVPGVVRVSGVIHNNPVQKHSAAHRYQLDKTADGLKVTLLNPDVLTPYPPEDLRPARDSKTAYLWLGLGGAVAVLIAGGLVVLMLRRRRSEDGSST